MAESKVAFIHSEQLEDKIAKLERRHEPLNHQTPRSYTPQQNLCAKIYQYDLYWPLPTLWALLCGNWMQVGYNQKGTYKAGVSYVLAYQVHYISWSSFNTILILEPGFDPGIDTPPSPHHLHTTPIPSLSRQANSHSALSQGP